MDGLSSYVVVDASVVIKWLVDEEDSDSAQLLLDEWIAQGVARAAPYLLPFEVTNVLHRQTARGLLTIEDGARLIDEMLASQVQCYDSLDIHRRALRLASQLGQGAAYDSHYLALAEVLDCEMWTADERLYRSASSTVPRLRLLSEFVGSASTG